MNKAARKAQEKSNSSWWNWGLSKVGYKNDSPEGS
jgi:hypothetical protein